MRPLRLVMPAYALLAVGVAAAQQPLTMLPPEGRAAPEMPHVTPAVQRPLTAAEAQALIGKSMRTRDAHPAGEIRDFTLAGPDGRIDRIVLAQGGFLGIGTKIYAVPAPVLRIGAAQRIPEPGQYRPMDISIDLTERELSAAPDFAYAPDTHTLVGRR